MTGTLEAAESWLVPIMGGGSICPPLVDIRLTDLPKPGWAIAFLFNDYLFPIYK